ncbi:MAG: hemolysin family protein [Phycisphaerae bacterium]|nr:hemolysin family protein [Phycisphaerae bacterium]
MLVPLVILAFLLLLNGFFAMAELAMMTSQQSRLQHAASRGSRGAMTAIRLAREPTRFLSTVQVGITLIGIFAGAFGESALSDELQSLVAKVPWLAEHSETIALIVVVLTITYFSVVFGELVPKRLALAYPEAIASAISRPLNVLSKVTAWPVRLLTSSTDLILRLLRIRVRSDDDVSEDDVMALVARAAGTGIFAPLEFKLLKRVFRVRDLTAASLVVPRGEIEWISEDATLESVRVLVGTSSYSHFPVCRNSLDEIVGVVHTRDLVAHGLLAGGNFRVAAIAQQPLFVPETMPALKLLDEFQHTRTRVAFVVDEYGGTQGLITLGDIINAVMGDVAQQTQKLRSGVVRRDDGSWLMDGSLALHEMVLVLSISPQAEEELPEVNTVAGLVLAQLGHIPSAGECAVWQGFTLEVVDMDGSRIDKVLATPKSAEG